MDKEKILEELKKDLTRDAIINSAIRDEEKPMGYLLTYIRDMYNLPKTDGWNIAVKVLEYFNIKN